jgi:2'-hydroxyisoflavone reductase
MKLLILGGTVFLGRHLVEAALAQGHEVTLFNRGQHNPDLFPAIEKLRGDRDGDLTALQGRRWDAAIDTCGYVPRVVRASADLLAGAVDRYIFISSISVYDESNAPGMDESAAVGTLQDESVEEITGETYGPLKALCERAVQDALPGGALVIRPGLIVGPHDPTDRFTYWPHRVAQGGEVLAPGRPGHPVQVIDVRDLAEWTLPMVQAGETGVYNATGPDYVLTMGALLDICQAVSGGDATFTWIDERYLLDQGVQPWSELPLWIPEDQDTLSTTDVRRAIAAGLTFCPIAQTVADTLDWAATRPADHAWRAGLDREREQTLLQAWRQRYPS